LTTLDALLGVVRQAQCDKFMQMRMNRRMVRAEAGLSGGPEPQFG
jgi:hypothetical protein